jgi:C_GCAxxG_C_C family probable redox protein
VDRRELVELAESYAAKGFLCSESVLLAISDLLGVHCTIIPRIATGFAAGLGGRGMACGAVTGGVMGLGIHLGRDEAKKHDRKAYWFAQGFLERFEKKHGALTCRELTGCDFATEEGRKTYEDGRLWETRCRQYIGTAAALAYDLIKDETKPLPDAYQDGQDRCLSE